MARLHVYVHTVHLAKGKTPLDPPLPLQTGGPIISQVCGYCYLTYHFVMDRKDYFAKKYLERKRSHKRVSRSIPLHEYQQFQAIATREGCNVSTLLLMMARAHRDDKYFVPMELSDKLSTLTRLIRNIANNINQLSHSANIFRDIDANRVFSHLADLDARITEFVDDKLK